MDKNKRKIILQTLFLVFLIAGTAYAAIERHNEQKDGNTNTYQTCEDMIFGTVMHATYAYDTDLHNEIMDELHKVDASLSMFNPKSNLALINKGETDKADSLLQAVYPLAQRISDATDGAFDVTVAPLVNAWGFGFKNGKTPTGQEVDSLRQLVDWRKVNIVDGKVVKSDPRMVIDLSAIAKGLGSDQVAKMFLRHGIKNFMVEIGGEVVTHGNNPKGEPWRIGINKPVDDATQQNNEIEKVLEVHDCAMATSGNYRNFYITEDGKKVAHTIDPKTGYPVQHSVLSSTVLAPTCAIADGFATSFMVLGLDKAKTVLKKHPELTVYLIYSDEKGKLKIWSNSKQE